MPSAASPLPPPPSTQGPGPGTRAMGVRACAAVCAVRFLVLPLVGAVIVVSSIRGGLFAPPDPVFAFLLLLQVSCGGGTGWLAGA